jgi:hypothetical protein
MTKPIQILVAVCGVAAIALAGFRVGISYAESNHARPLHATFEESPGGDSYTFYTYYIGPKGEKVLHGKHYVVSGANKVVTDYQDGRNGGFSATTNHP